jgi:hypothetical protein
MSTSSVHESSPSEGVSPAIEGGFQALHRRDISVTSITTPVFPLENLKEDSDDVGPLGQRP